MSKICPRSVSDGGGDKVGRLRRSSKELGGDCERFSDPWVLGHPDGLFHSILGVRVGGPECI